jgi:hypothetical protein
LYNQNVNSNESINDKKTLDMTKKLQISQICSIEPFVNYVNNRYTWKKEKKISLFGVTLCVTQREGFYYDTVFSEEPRTEEHILSNKIYEIRDNRVFYKPHLEFRMSNGNIYTKYFNTVEEMIELLSQINPSDIFIEL